MTVTVSHGVVTRRSPPPLLPSMPLKALRGSGLASLPKAKAAFIEPLLLLRTEELPEGAEWMYEIEARWILPLGIKTEAQVQFRSRNDNDFNSRYPAIVKTLSALPNDTVIDGVVVVVDESGRPSFNILQNAHPKRRSCTTFSMF